VRAIQISEFGGPEVLRLVDLPDPEQTGTLAVYDVHAAGVNYADTLQAEDGYLTPQTLPMVPGGEFAGVGPDGRRVVGLLLSGGGYAEKVSTITELTWPVPDGVGDGAALTVVVQGSTAWHALHTCAHLAVGESVLVHAAAGGVGTLAVQLAKAAGARRVIGLASTAEKRELALELGADAVLDPGAEDLKAAVEEANGGRKVDVVLETTGGPVFDASLAALAPFGRLVTYGMASRVPPTPIEPAALLTGSRAVIGFWLARCVRRPAMLHEPIRRLLEMIRTGALRPVVGGTYPLADARRAHEDIRARRTTGKLVLDTRR